MITSAPPDDIARLHQRLWAAYEKHQQLWGRNVALGIELAQVRAQAAAKEQSLERAIQGACRQIECLQAEVENEVQRNQLHQQRENALHREIDALTAEAQATRRQTTDAHLFALNVQLRQEIAGLQMALNDQFSKRTRVRQLVDWYQGIADHLYAAKAQIRTLQADLRAVTNERDYLQLLKLSGALAQLTKPPGPAPWLAEKLKGLLAFVHPDKWMAQPGQQTLAEEVTKRINDIRGQLQG
jgi:chromosome segregation ATPase